MRILGTLFTIILSIMLLSACAKGRDLAPSPPPVGVSEVTHVPSSFVPTPPPIEEAKAAAPLYFVIYSEPNSRYQIIASDIIDTLFIAGALYHDFESSSLCPANYSQSYDEVREYFTAYKEHPFITGFGRYANDMMQDVNGDAVTPLIYYILGEEYNAESAAFYTDSEDVKSFIDALEQFYEDTNAGDFLEECNLRREQLSYVPGAAQDLPLSEFFTELEAYIGQGSDTVYYSLLTPFRPQTASFYACSTGDEMRLVSLLSPYSFEGEHDMRQILETTIHESLHVFINSHVAAQSELIDRLTQGRSPEAYTCQLYLNAGHSWNRIVDEAVVRAVQAGIYRRVYGDSDKAFNELLVKEMNAGIVNLDKMYEALLEYEGDRVEYLDITTFLETLIRQYLR